MFMRSLLKNNNLLAPSKCYEWSTDQKQFFLFHTTDLYNHDGLDEETRKILAIQTYYEKMWLERGLNIKYMKFRLPHDVTLTEPDVEIELDDYRSYRRDKRSSLDKAK